MGTFTKRCRRSRATLRFTPRCLRHFRSQHQARPGHRPDPWPFRRVSSAIFSESAKFNLSKGRAPWPLPTRRSPRRDTNPCRQWRINDEILRVFSDCGLRSRLRTPLSPANPRAHRFRGWRSDAGPRRGGFAHSNNHDQGFSIHPSEHRNSCGRKARRRFGWPVLGQRESACGECSEQNYENETTSTSHRGFLLKSVSKNVQD